MAIITGTHGKQIEFTVLGLPQVIEMLAYKGQIIKQGADMGAIRASTLMKEEIQSSIAGQKAELKSVDTGEFLNSIAIGKVSDGISRIYSDVPQAVFMEYGTSRGIEPRSHFRNSLARNKDNILKLIKEHTADKV